MYSYLYLVLAPLGLRKQFLDGVRLEVAFFQCHIRQTFSNILNNFQCGLKLRFCIFVLASLEQLIAHAIPDVAVNIRRLAPNLLISG